MKSKFIFNIFKISPDSESERRLSFSIRLIGRVSIIHGQSNTDELACSFMNESERLNKLKRTL